MTPNTTTIGDDLRAFAARLLESQVESLADRYTVYLRALDVPLMSVVAHLPEDALRAMQIQGMRLFLTDLAAGNTLVANEESLRKWEADELEGVSRDAVVPADLVLVYHAQERAMLDLVAELVEDRQLAQRITYELRDLYVAMQRGALEVFARIRAEAVERAVRAENEREEAVAAQEELQMVNEELSAQTEELAAQQEELQHLHDTLQRQNESLEGEVERRTQELAHEKTFIERLVDHVPVGIAYLDRNLEFRRVNPVFAAFANQDATAYAGRSYYDVFPQAPRPATQLVSVLESGQVLRQVALPVETPGGEATYWDIICVPVFDETGAVDGLILMSQNATERVQHEQLQQAHIDQLKEMDRLKDEFLSVLSHELRTPINGIMGFASILADGLAGPLSEQQTRFTQRILDGSDVLLALINDLLDMSRIQAGKFSLEPSPTDLADVARRVAGATAHLAERRHQRLAIEVPPDLPVVTADAQRIGQVMTNLVSNAIKFGADGDTITLRVKPAGERVVCEVEDHGEGIAEEDLSKLFQRFTQLDMGTTRRAGGTGLGLYIVKALVESHGGEVGVCSDPGQRTIFWFALPREGKPVKSVRSPG